MTTELNSKTALPEEVDRWIEQFSNYLEAQKIEIDGANKEFISLERAYWMGIIAGRGAEAIPPGLQMILFAYRSPLLEYKSPLKKRIRRTKAEIEAAAREDAVVDANVRDQRSIPPSSDPEENPRP